MTGSGWLDGGRRAGAVLRGALGVAFVVGLQTLAAQGAAAQSAGPQSAGPQSAGPQQNPVAQGPAAAAPAASAPNGRARRTPRASEIGHATTGWLDLQRSDAEAGREPTTLGAEATLAYQRYLDSFKNKIPSSFGSSVGSGDAGNSMQGGGYGNGGGAQN
ncbi:DUF3613 domain-containing protein [Paraburkholderia jirisanensis]